MTIKQKYDMRVCPRCKSKNTSWRKGYQFDHERFCWVCLKSYDPADEEKKAKESGKAVKS